MSAPSTAQVLMGLALVASERQRRIAEAGSAWRCIAHVGDGNAHPPVKAKAVTR